MARSQKQELDDADPLPEALEDTFVRPDPGPGPGLMERVTRELRASQAPKPAVTAPLEPRQPPDQAPPQLGPERTLSPGELDRLIAGYRGTVDDVLMTKELAVYILSTYNTGNRTLRAMHANSFADTLQRGGWQNTGEAVIFAKEGVLNNGQHRLQGVVRSGIAATMDLRFGIPRSAFSVTDTGSKRQAGDVISIAGTTANPFAVAAALRLLLAYERGLPGAYVWAKKIGNDEILQALLRWPDIDAACDLTKRTLHRRGFVNGATNAFTFLAVRSAGQEPVEEFLGLVETGLTRSKTDAPRVLRERMLNDGLLGRNSQNAVVERFGLFIKAWNFWRDNERVKMMRLRSDEAYPSIDVPL